MQSSEAAERYSLAFSAIQTDAGFACEGLSQVSTLSGFVYTHSYHFTDENAPSLFHLSYVSLLGAAHAFEIQYLLDTEQTMLERGAEQISLSSAMIDYWTTFSKTGNPNPESAYIPQWPKFDTGLMLNLKADIESKSSVDFSTTHSCAYWSNPPNNL